MGDKLTPTRAGTICAALRDGAPRVVAAHAAGIAPSTLYRWLERGEAAHAGRHREFWEAARAAEAEAVTRALAVLWRSIEDGDGRLALEYLSRRWPAEFGRRALEVTGAEGGPMTVQVEHTSAKATLEAKLERLARRRREIREAAGGEAQNAAVPG